MKAILLAAIAAIGVQPLGFLLWLGVPILISGGSLPPLSDFGAIAVVTSLVATPFVLAIGIPAALLLRHHPRRGWWLAAIGFVVAALPVALLSSPRAATLDDLGPTLIFGLHGLVGATVFHAAYRVFPRNSIATTERPANGESRMIRSGARGGA
ncbi:MAG: hypothetical protein ACRC2H_03155 [Silanimonas sp.]